MWACGGIWAREVQTDEVKRFEGNKYQQFIVLHYTANQTITLDGRW